jgi:diguanylate cyclase (GGDEF)-like protein
MASISGKLKRSIQRSTIMVVDRDAKLKDLYAHALQEEGHTTLTVNTWSEALAILHKKNVDLVLLEYAQQEKTAEEIVLDIKEISSRIRVILLFTDSDAVSRRELLDRFPIQGCHEKKEGVEKLFLWVNTALKILTIRDLLHQGLSTIKSQVKIIEKNKEGLRYIINAMPETISRLQPLDKFIRGVLIQLNGFIESDSSFLATVDENDELILLVGTGQFDMNEKDFLTTDLLMKHNEKIEAVRSGCAPIIEEHKVYLPLTAKDKVIGILYLEKKNTDIKELEVEMLKLFASQAAITIENSNLFKLATVDGLTGLYVRRYFLQRFQEVLQFASRFGGQAVSLLLFDIDHFKAINDTYGHPAGDKVLARVSEILRESVRATDITGRLGGEEFALLLIDTAQEQAFKLAESIRLKIETEKFLLENKPYPVTISIGQCSCDTYLISADTLKTRSMSELAKHDVRRMLTAADQALYASKDNGRNRVTLADNLEPS